MNVKRLLPFAALALLFTVGIAAAQDKTSDKPHRILFAVTSADEADWNLTFGNIGNLLKAIPDAEIEVVAYGPGVTMVVKPSSADAAIQRLLTQHVRFVACQNAMRARHVTEADLVTGVGTVPAGIVEVVTKQEQGWVYIHAGR